MEGAVVVDFHIADAVAAEELDHALVKVLDDFRFAEVEEVAVERGRVGYAFPFDEPFRVFFEERGCFGDAFEFKPDAGDHAGVADGVEEAVEAGGIARFVDFPVADARKTCFGLAEPACVHDEIAQA